MHEVDAGYIEAQYAFLDELISISDGRLDAVEPDCITGGLKVKAPREHLQK